MNSRPEIDADELDRLYVIATRRLAEMGFTAEELDLVLGCRGKTQAGRSPEGWDPEKGVVFCATATRSRIQSWLEEAYVREWNERPSWEKV